jgi:hypothetical protein
VRPQRSKDHATLASRVGTAASLFLLLDSHESAGPSQRGSAGRLIHRRASPERGQVEHHGGDRVCAHWSAEESAALRRTNSRPRWVGAVRARVVIGNLEARLAEVGARLTVPAGDASTSSVALSDRHALGIDGLAHPV